MRDEAIAAVLDAVFQVSILPAAIRSLRIERAIAEQAVEPLRICACMAGKILTVPVGKAGKAFPFPPFPVHAAIFMILHHRIPTLFPVSAQQSR